MKKSIKKLLLRKIKDLKSQRSESEKDTKFKSKYYDKGWEDGYDSALDIFEEFVEDLPERRAKIGGIKEEQK